MTKIKETSTNQSNKATALYACPVTFTLTKIGGRWKPLIIFNLRDGPKRYSELRKRIPAITEKMLIHDLKELEADQLVSRQVLAVVPPHVEYRLTPSGEELGPAMQEMANWGLKYREPGF
jgi:DNA-binding HxlR family transcriptional regulator